MKTRMNAEGKREFEKTLVIFEDCTYTKATKTDLLIEFRDYLENAKDGRCAEAIADITWQMEVDGKLLDSSDGEITMAMAKRAGFILYYNDTEFQAWIGDAAMMQKLGGAYTIQKIWE